MLLISLTWLFVQVTKGILSVVCGVCLSGKRNPKTNMFAVVIALLLCCQMDFVYAQKQYEFGPKCQKGGISVVVGALNLLRVLTVFSLSAPSKT